MALNRPNNRMLVSYGEKLTKFIQISQIYLFDCSQSFRNL